MIAPFNFKKFENKILITNDIGRYHLLTINEFYAFINEKIEKNSILYQELKDKYFLIDSSIEAYLENVKPQLRTAKGYLFSATSLHIFVVTNFCNSECIYCQAKSNIENCSKKMDEEIAKKSIQIALQSPQNEINFEFQGGEPLSNYNLIKYIIEYTEENKGEKIVYYNIVTNLTLLTREMLEFFKKYNVSLSTSLDGNEMIHNYNRPLANRANAYSIVTSKLAMIKDAGINIGAIQTTTRKAISEYRNIVDSYVLNGLDSIFLRPLTPLGYAAEHWENIGYSVEEFVDFYNLALEYILILNLNGKSNIKEGHATIFLQKIVNGVGVNYMELRSPCGASIGQVAYYYDGNIFTCDEARMLYEMGDDSFKIGNVFENDYNDIMESKVTKTICKYSIIEALPKCNDCVYNCYCGTCPVINYALEQDIISRRYADYKCKIYEGMLNTIFRLMLDEQYRDILESWV